MKRRSAQGFMANWALLSGCIAFICLGTWHQASLEGARRVHVLLDAGQAALLVDSGRRLPVPPAPTDYAAGNGTLTLYPDGRYTVMVRHQYRSGFREKSKIPVTPGH